MMDTERRSLIARKVAEILLGINAVELRPDKPFTFSSGVVSPIYCDNRLLMAHPDRRREIINFMVEVLRNEDVTFDILAAVASSGIPHCAWLADRLNKPMIYVRKHAKDYGKGRRIEGVLKRGDRAIVIEDLISTGGSSLDVVDVLREEGVIVDVCLSIFTYDMKIAKQRFNEKRCRLISLSSIDVLLDVAFAKGIINEEEKSRILEWREDPEKWRKKYVNKA